ncbi:hypothetical protein SDC9_174639 [bioreactor metagenome]|uniref:N-acetyltransferase domain-containing protein n=1 Tax=bioreactor metagenome TaxID=1076179 RepID=A0A645GJS5_9ZZZZ
MGSALYRALIEILRLQNFQNLYGIIGIPNDASVALHAKFGFETIGRYHETGYKLGKWHDVVIMEKALGDKSCPPEAVIPVTGIPIEKISQILAEGKNMYLQKNIGE